MKRFLLAGACALLAQTANAQLLITGVIDGPLSGGVPKAIELYVAEDIDDLSKFGIGSANNGGGTDGVELPLSGSASEGDFIYIASESQGFDDFFGFDPDFVGGAANINGDDAIELFCDGTVVDTFGDIDVDGTGQPWEHLDGWAYRVNGTAAKTPFSIVDWFFSGTNALDGETTNALATTPFPIGTYSPSGADVGAGCGEPELLINEVDADTAGTDMAEFVELYDGGAGNTPLDGFSVVFFNGSDDASYGDAFDLDGFSTDANGYFVLGNAGVNGVSIVFPSNGLQNGADAVALVQGDASDYPEDTPVASVSNLIDAVIYDTNDGDDAGLAALAPGFSQLNEDELFNKDGHSNQRCPDGAGGALVSTGFIQAPPTPGAENCAVIILPITLISEIQGDAESSPLDGQLVAIEGVVVGDFQGDPDGVDDADVKRSLEGFYVQEEASDSDGLDSTSEGIFVFEGALTTDVRVGDLVRVAGTVDEYFGMTQIDTVTEITVLESGVIDLVDNAFITLPTDGNSAAQDGDRQAYLEPYEGMLVEFTDTLQITEQFNLDRFNEIRLVQGERPVQFTQNNAPNPDLFEDHLGNLGARSIVYDDGLNEQNAPIGGLDGFGPVYSSANAKRMGDTVNNLRGVLDYQWAGSSASLGTWRVRSIEDGDNTFTSTEDGNSPNPRPESAPEVDGTFTVASYNVLNFFTTLDDGSLTANGNGPRGADDIDEFNRQLDKLVQAIIALDADVIGLVEIENEFNETPDIDTAIETLLAAINAVAERSYDFVYPGTEFVGGDAIAVALIYDTETVRIAPGTTPAILDDTLALTFPGVVDTIAVFEGEDSNRIPVAASFEHINSLEQFTVAVNHFKSKGGEGTGLNADMENGAGNWNQRRLDAAVAIEAWLNSQPTGLDDEDTIILGDLNAYLQEDPVQHLLSNGYTNVEDPDGYSFVFDGQVGTLDYVLISDSLVDRFVGAEVWHINADEADAIDYNLDFGRDPAIYDGSSPARNSDHDPLIAGFDFSISIADISSSVNALIDAGTLEPAGSRASTQRYNLRSFTRRLDSAQRFAARGRTRTACTLMGIAYARVDGDPRPGDQLVGPGAADIAAAIAQFRRDNCED